MSLKKLKYILIFLQTFSLAFSVINIRRRNVDIKDKCIFYIGDVKVDLNKLFRIDGYKIRHENRQFLLNICGSVKECEINDIKDVAVCEVSDKTKSVTILGLTNNMHSIQIFKPNLGLRYTYTDHVKKKHITEIEFKCNINIENYNLTFVSKNNYGKKNNFIFESNMFCIKKPLNCLFKDVAEEFSYDLSPLYNDDYKIFHESSTIILNICGNLRTNLTNECKDPRTQICLIDKNGNYKNLGRFSTNGIQYIDNNNYISVIYSDGSACDTGSYIETQIDFKCSSVEKSPSILFSSSCKYRIIWETNHACPHYNITYKNCEITNHFYEDRNFMNLLNNSNEIQIKNMRLYYNVCSVLHKCNGYENVSICLKEGNEEKVYGWKNTDIFFNDGNLTMEYIGSKCNSESFYSTRINFICSYSDHVHNYVDYVHYPCRIFINYYTKAACSLLEIDKKNCTLKVNSNIYDISPLKLLDNNYIIKDPKNKNVDYILNICHPLISDSQSLCDSYSAVCRRNHSEPDIRKKFNSLGSYNNEKSELYFNNEFLSLKYFDGNFCKLDKKYKTEIKFICTIDEESEGPELLHHDNCYYLFEWKTKYACQNVVIKPIVDNTITKIENVITKIENVKNDSVLTYNNPVKYSEHIVTTTIINKRISSTTERYMLDLNIDKALVVKNCIITDQNNDRRFNLTYLPQNLQVTSGNGKKYSMNFCHKEQNKCQSHICGGIKYETPYSDKKVIIDVNTTLSQVKLHLFGHNICNEGYYNSTVIMRCAEKLQDPTVTSEDECSVQFEWYNNATCSFLNIQPNIERTLSAEINIGLICGVLLTIVGLLIFVFYWWRKSSYKQLCNDKQRTIIYYEKDTML